MLLLQVKTNTCIAPQGSVPLRGFFFIDGIIYYMKIYILDGIGSHNRADGIVMKQVADTIKEKVNISEVRWINWPASMSGIGGPLSWVEASNIGKRMLTEQIERDKEEFILLAYSGGNKPARDWLYENPELRKLCKSVGLVSDPERPRDRWQNGLPDPGGWGISGEDYGPVREMTFWTSVPGDVISSARPDALLRTFSDLSAGPPEFAVQNARPVLLNKNRFQLGYQLEVPFIEWFTTLGRRISEALEDIYRYQNGWHTSHYVGPVDNGPSLSQRMGASIAWRINNQK